MTDPGAILGVDDDPNERGVPGTAKIAVHAELGMNTNLLSTRIRLTLESLGQIAKPLAKQI
jgi:hypothetical protein